MTTLDIYRPGSPPTLQASVNISDSTIYLKKLMAEHKIISEFYASSVLSIELGDYIVYNSESFFINRSPEIEKINSQTYKYSVEFESETYNLYNKKFLYDGLAEFDYTGAPVDFLTLIVAQINTIDAGWSVGNVDTLGEINITFSNVSCRQALSQVAEEFKMEYSIAAKVIALKTTVGTSTLNVFEYGRGNGLYKLTRKQVSDQNIVTRVYGFGGSTNIGSGYRDRAKKLVFEEAFTLNRYLENNVSLYGIIEGVYNDENIFPQRTGTLSAVHIEYDGNGDFDPNLSYVEDSTLDFDVNDYEVGGLTKTIIFKSGDLSGYQFEIWLYDHANKRFYFNIFQEPDGYPLPNSLNLPIIGDTYTLVNISMPQSYIDAAETALQAATLAFLNQNSVPQVTYELDIDPKYIKTNSISLNVGDLVTIYDLALGINTLIRVMDLEFPLVNPNKIKATISDTVLYTTSERVILATVKNTQNIVKTKRQSLEISRRNAATFKVLRSYLLDADNEFSQDLIKAARIQALLAEFGTSAGNFILTPTPTFLDNYTGDANSFLAPGCTLSHLEISILIAGVESFDWVIPELSFATLTPATAYYLYAKCSKAQATGVWELSSSVIPSDQTGFYYFPIGVLLPVDAVTLVRAFVTTYGKTYINGSEITAGKIQSADGGTYFDLTNNKLVINGQRATESKSLFSDIFKETLASFNSRWGSYSGSGETTIETDADAKGGNVLRIGNNSGNDQRWYIGNDSIPYDPNRLYRVKVRFRRTAGTGTIYIGVAGRDATDTSWVNITGIDTAISSQHYFAAAGATSADWVIANGYFKGLAASGNGAVHSNPLIPGTMHSNVRFFRPLILGNFSSLAGTVEVDYIEIDYAEEDAAQSSATTAQTAAATAQTAANTANTAIGNIVSDNVLDKGEKPRVKSEYDVIIAEQSGIDAKATAYGITTEKTTYDTAVSALTTYLTGLSPAYTLFTSDTTIVGTTFRTKFQDVYTTKQALLNKIYDAAKVLADAAQLEANNIKNGVTKSAGGNLCKNGDFEHGVGTWLKYNNGSDAGVVLSIENSGGLYGVNCAKVTVPAGGATVTLGICQVAWAIRDGWTPNKTYVVSGWTKGAGLFVGHTIALRWDTAPASTTTLVNPAISSTWQRFEFRILMGASVEGNGRIYIDAGAVAGAGDIYFDGIQITEGHIPTAFSPSPWDAVDFADAAQVAADAAQVDATAAQDTVDTFIAGTYADDIASIQNQLDGVIVNWFLEGVPTLSNAPAVDWTTTALKDEHLGDLYYDLLTGYAYRFILDTTYQWFEVPDTAAAALAAAADAQDTADGKRRVFTATPTTPYDVGDLWLTSLTAGLGDIKKCITALGSGSYNAAHWVIASKYTDDTTANQAIADAAAAQSAADDAQADATDALSQLTNITSDNVLSKNEKPIVKLDYDTIIAEQSGIDTRATAYGITTEKTAYDNAVTALTSYLTGLSPAYTEFTSDTTIVGATFRTKFQDVYTTRQALLNKIYEAAKTLADTAQTTADSKVETFYQTGIPTSVSAGDIWYDTDDKNKMYRAAVAGATIIAAGQWVLVRDTDIAQAIADAAAAQSTADTAETNAQTGITDAATANGLLADIASDSKLTPVEKQSVRQEWNVIAAELAVNDAQATTFGITTEKTTYDNAFQTLATYLNGGVTWTSGIPSWIADANLGATTTIVGATFRTNWKAYYDARTALLNAISAKAKTLADTAQSAADAAQTDATAAQAAAESAQTDATTALTDLANIAADTKLSKGEKPFAIREYNTLIAEQSGIDAKADTWNITTEKTNYDTAVSALTTYLTGLSQWNVVTVDTTIVAATWETKWKDVYTTRQTLLNKIFDLASLKKRHFTAQPTTPYAVGDTWSTGNNLYVCTTARVTGSYVAGDWVLATTYDNTKDYVDNTGLDSGTISAFVLAANMLSFSESNKNLYLNNQIKISGNYGRGLTIYDSAAAYATKQIAAVSVGQIRPLNSIAFNATTEYGFEIIQAYGAGTFKHLVRIGENSALIAGWKIDYDAIYIGAKKITDGLADAGSFTIASNGSIHAQKFSIDSGGTVTIKDLVFSYSGDGALQIKYDSITNPYNYPGKLGYINIGGEVAAGVKINLQIYKPDASGLSLYQSSLGWNVEEKLKINAGLEITGAVTASTSYNLLNTQGSFIYTGTGTGNVYLPASGQQTGQIHIIVNRTTGYAVTVHGNGSNIYDGGNTYTTRPVGDRESMSFMWNGTCWSTIAYR